MNNTINRNDIIVLDTETTGLGDDAVVCEIAIIDGFGNTLLNSLVDPQAEIPAGAIAIHGITNEMVKGQPTFHEILPKVKSIISGRTLCIYNAGYDLRIISQSISFEQLLWNRIADSICVMKDYAEYYGEVNYYGDFKWQKLVNACEQQGIDTSKFNAHRALADCQMTLALMNKFMVIEG
ncbi:MULTISPECIES: 3'-5' exonuclease [unclassified Pseudoalteromonas]|uniref:3'-5' exonuclease n=2 Tax=Pseudoalteromonas TaxID=53246 RepID=UPI001F2427B3|nr:MULTISPECIES: 3'-5' exonuclease [unclassified Pseudoalteromonas]MCF2826807.1 3'-5' exonuclease [Pseudoalteromonas sp. OF5H-5]MCF2833640.1 3'-5' exonuclease [Pseudoalteromonas sp. DL2-H6]